MKKELSILSIFTMSGPGEFSRVETKKRQAPLLAVPFRQFFKFQPCDHAPPEPKNFDF